MLLDDNASALQHAGRGPGWRRRGPSPELWRRYWRTCTRKRIAVVDEGHAEARARSRRAWPQLPPQTSARASCGCRWQPKCRARSSSAAARRAGSGRPAACERRPDVEVRVDAVKCFRVGLGRQQGRKGWRSARRTPPRRVLTPVSGCAATKPAPAVRSELTVPPAGRSAAAWRCRNAAPRNTRSWSRVQAVDRRLAACCRGAAQASRHSASALMPAAAQRSLPPAPANTLVRGCRRHA